MEISVIALSAILNSTGLHLEVAGDSKILEAETSKVVVEMMISPDLRPSARELFKKKFEDLNGKEKELFNNIVHDAILNCGSGRNPFA